MEHPPCMFLSKETPSVNQIPLRTDKRSFLRGHGEQTTSNHTRSPATALQALERSWDEPTGRRFIAVTAQPGDGGIARAPVQSNDKRKRASGC